MSSLAVLCDPLIWLCRSQAGYAEDFDGEKEHNR